MSAALLNKFQKFISPNQFRHFMNWWPPFKAMAVTVDEISANFQLIKISMDLKWYNRNYVGTQFGGGLYAMVDPFYMLMLLKNLGKQFSVWDKSAEIFFKRQGRGKVFAHFKIEQNLIDHLKSSLAIGEKRDLELVVDIFDDNGEVICVVHKVIFLKKLT